MRFEGGGIQTTRMNHHIKIKFHIVIIFGLEIVLQPLQTSAAFSSCTNSSFSLRDTQYAKKWRSSPLFGRPKAGSGAHRHFTARQGAFVALRDTFLSCILFKNSLLNNSPNRYILQIHSPSVFLWKAFKKTCWKRSNQALQ
jgi:hypothetical protein